jgi:hypothetical protein
LSPFGTVGRAVGGHEVQGVVGEFPTLVGVQLLCALLPGIAERNEVVDLDIGAGVLRPRVKVIVLPVYPSAKVPVVTKQLLVPGLNVSFVKSRARISLWGVAAVAVNVSPAGPNSSRL